MPERARSVQGSEQGNRGIAPDQTVSLGSGSHVRVAGAQVSTVLPWV